jgi:alkanesulfonate monooxygenase
MDPTFQDINGIDVYTSSPSDSMLSSAAYLARLRTVSQWSDRAGCRGMLIYTDNRSLDPWVLAYDVIAHTTRLAPLIAMQPVYMHPYAAAQKIGALAHLYGRSIDVNFVAGGFKFDLAALDDRLEHDARYERLSEYGVIFARLIKGERVTFQGRYYKVFGLKLDTHTGDAQRPRLTVSGSSAGGLRCAEAIGATAVMYPKPLESEASRTAATSAEAASAAIVPTGIRIGILARETADEAWRVAARRFPDDAEARARRQAGVQTSDSSWLHQLGALTQEHSGLGGDVYWTGPFASGKSFCPYLVGAYDDVASYLSAYLQRDVRVIILDCPSEEEDLRHAHTVLQRAVSRVVSLGV